MELIGIIRLDEINDSVRENEYNIYTKKELDKLLDTVCETFLTQYLETS